MAIGLMDMANHGETMIHMLSMLFGIVEINGFQHGAKATREH